MGKRGPAPKGEFTGNSAVLSIRIRPDTRAGIEAASKKSGRSMSQECQARLQRSLDADQKIADDFGSRRNYRVWRILSDLLAQSRVDQDWLDNPEKFDTARAAIISGLDFIASTTLPTQKRKGGVLSAAIRSAAGGAAARDLFQEMEEARADAPLTPAHRREREMARARDDLGIAKKPGRTK